MTDRSPTGSTTVVGVIGDPVAHSLSPVIHNAAFAALGLDWVYVALPVPAGRGGATVAAMPVLGIVGLNVTMPHKADAAMACDDLSDDARRLGVVNTVALRDGRLLGSSTDGPGFLASLADAGVEVAGRRTLVLGAGGAARAVVVALARAGADVTVAARRPEAAAVVVTTLAAERGGPTARAVALDPAGADVARADLVVNPTPIGMGGDGGVPVDVAVLAPHAVVADLVYHPVETPLLAAARARDLVVVDGLGMLVHQAALAQEVWTGRPAPVAVMTRAARTVVDARQGTASARPGAVSAE